MPRDRLIILFAKYPTPGKVKTRLLDAIMPDQAAELHLRCLKACIAAARAVSNADLIVAQTPDDKDFSPIIGDGVPTVSQGPGPLGDRLLRGVQNAFDGGRRRVALIGADCPALQPGHIERAFALLDAHEVVIGPALDGGYYLLGLRGVTPSLFQDIDWGGPAVAEQTRQRAATAGLTIAELAALRDIDTREDLARAAEELDAADAHLVDLANYIRTLIRPGDSRG